MSDITLLLGDCLEKLRELPSDSVDALLTDPPAGINFMNQDFDSDRGGRDAWIAWLSAIMQEALRVVKPGGHALVWALPRTSHWTGMALEKAGWEIRDSIHHGFSTGMIKSRNISKDIDARLGAERLVVGNVPQSGAKFKLAADAISNGGFNSPDRKAYEVTAPATPEAKAAEGFGTGVSPAHEVWWLCRKPLVEKTIAEQFMATGTGAINIDACRVGTRNQTIVRGGNRDRSAYGKFAHDDQVQEFHYETGRCPSNAIFSHDEACVPTRVTRVASSNPIHREEGSAGLTGATYSGGRIRQRAYESPGYAEEDGKEAVIEYQCVEGCAVLDLNRQGIALGLGKSGSMASDTLRGVDASWFSPGAGTMAAPRDYHGGSGPISRFFPVFHPFRYQPKPARSEREMGCDSLPLRSAGEVTGGREEGSAGLDSPRAGAGRGTGLRNFHPTIKGIDLMAWMLRLICPPNGVALDVFAGSGVVGLACQKEGMSFIGIELNPEYFAIATARNDYVRGVGLEELPLFRDLAEPKQASLCEGKL